MNDHSVEIRIVVDADTLFANALTSSQDITGAVQFAVAQYLQDCELVKTLPVLQVSAIHTSLGEQRRLEEEKQRAAQRNNGAVLKMMLEQMKREKDQALHPEKEPTIFDIAEILHRWTSK